MVAIVTQVFDGQDTYIADVAYTRTTDTLATIPHTLAGTPAEYTILPLLLQGWAGRPHITAVDSTNVIVTKLSTAGSSNAAAQLRVIIKRPHSLGR